MLPDLLQYAPLAMGSLLFDIMTGERLFFFHPVPLMGRMVVWTERLIRSSFSPKYFKPAGVFLPLVLCSVFGGGSWLVLSLVQREGGTLVRECLEVYWATQLLASRSLYDHVLEVAYPLGLGDLSGARIALSRIVGRDTDGLGREGIARGALESLWENTNDALVAPLFYLVLGGVPLLMAYKASSTLDSMVGYKNERYRSLGWASARMDDMMAWIPARLTFALMFLFLLPFIAPQQRGHSRISGKNSVLSIAFRFRRAHPSPNSGYPIAAFSALRGVRLGGGAYYFGRWVEKPFIGAGPDPDVADLHAGLRIYRMFVFSLVVLLAILSLFRWSLLQ